MGVTADDIAEILSRRTGIPVAQLTESEKQRLLGLEDALHERVVGKTELAKALAQLLFGDEDRMIRFDMSEFQEKHTVSRLVGSPPGYVGYEDAAQLTDKVRRRPYSVLLFDEIEEAHPDVFNTLLQVLDDGRLTDAKGRTVDFRHTVVILMSNIGSQLILAHQGRVSEIRDQLYDQLKARFLPEFLNRIDEIVVFNALDRDDLGSIVELLLDGTAQPGDTIVADIGADGELRVALAGGRPENGEVIETEGGDNSFGGSVGGPEGDG